MVQPRRVDPVFLLVAMAVLGRLLVSRAALNLFYNYDLGLGGALALKIHPGTYALALIAILLPVLRPRRSDLNLALPGYAILTAAALCIGWTVWRGDTSSAGFLVDGLGSAGAALLCLARLSSNERKSLSSLVLLGLAADAALTIGEFALQQRMLPYQYHERIFRPTALFAHPLYNGLFLVTGIPLACALRGTLGMRLSLAALITLAVFASGARLASVVSIPISLISILVAFGRERDRSTSQTLRLIQATLMVAILPALALVALASGFGYRLAGGLFDQSAQARVTVYAVLKYLSTSELLTGLGSAALYRYTTALLNQRVESPFVALIFEFGIILGAIYLAAVLFAVAMCARKGRELCWITAAAFLIVACSNAVIVSKVPCLLLIFVVLAGLAQLERSSVAVPAGSAPRRRNPTTWAQQGRWRRQAAAAGGERD